MPLVRFSVPIVKARVGTSGPIHTCTMYIRFDDACSTPANNSARMTPNRSTRTPPNATPASVAATP